MQLFCQLIYANFFTMKVCGVEDITGASEALNLGSIPSRPVTGNGQILRPDINCIFCTLGCSTFIRF